jgi:hypothetical protein
MCSKFEEIKKSVCPGGVVYIVVIVSANGTEDRGFESRKGVRILGLENVFFEPKFALLLYVFEQNKCPKIFFK